MTEHPTIRQFARMRNVPRSTMFRRLLAMHAADRAAEPDFVPWLFRYAGGPWRVNVSRLRRSHPEHFDVASLEEIVRRLSRVELQEEKTDAGHRALVVRVRNLAAEVEGLKTQGREGGIPVVT